VALRAGVKVQLFLGAANRDPRKWDQPDRFDITRSTMGHVALGSGVHHCVGQIIARLEAECLRSAIVKRVARIRLAGAPMIRPVNGLRTLGNLQLSIILA
jgi:cytochrome P450